MSTLLAQAPQTVSPVGRSTQQTVKVEGCHGQAGCIPVDINGAISASTSGRATAASPTYVEGTDNPLSIDLAGNIRTLATAVTAAAATAASPTYVEGSTSALSQDLSGYLRTRAKQDGSWTNACTQSGTWTVQPGNTANTTAWKVDGSAVTQPVSGTFWQSTQPVSGTVAATQSGTWTVQPGNTANTTAWKVDGSAVTQPVSGTFWQATQPVSGTFWQATQPVSGTFWQATQPVSGPLTDTQLRASAVPVSGTFWQATQPISGTVTDNQGTTPWIVQPQDPTDTTGTLTTNASSVTVTLGHGEAVCGLTIAGTWTTNTAILFQGAQDGSTYNQISGWGNLSGNYFSQTVANASFELPAANFKTLRVLVNGGTWTGTANVTWHCSIGSQPPSALGLTAVTNGNNATAATNGTIVSAKGDTEGRVLVRDYGSNPFSNQQSGIAASAVLKTNVASLRLHVTDFHIVIVSGTSPTAKIVYGTGSTCGTGTTSLTPTYAVAGTYAVSLRTPLIAIASNDLCVIISGTTPVVHVLISGYVAP